MAEDLELEYLVLVHLASADGPVGSGIICDWLRQAGSDISEATVGRFLRELDLASYTERSGFRGRTLTEKGRARLTQLEHDRALAHSSTQLMSALRPGDLDDVVGVLIARRALEREVARLAALSATDRDIEALESLLGRYEIVSDPAAAAAADFTFHARLAEVTGNKVLQAATRLIHAEAQSVMIPESIRSRLKPTLGRQHVEILDAIRQRDPERAEKIMIQHLNLLIDAVEQHRAEQRS